MFVGRGRKMNKVYLINIFGIFGLFLFQLFLVFIGINSSLTKKKRKKLGIKNKMKIMYGFSCLWVFKFRKLFVFYKLLVIYIYLLSFANFFFYILYISKNAEVFYSLSQIGLVISACSIFVIIIYNYVYMKFEGE